MYKALSVGSQRCTKKKITLRCMVIGTCAVQFLHEIPLYRNTQHYATLNCSVKASLRVGGTQKKYIHFFVLVRCAKRLKLRNFFGVGASFRANDYFLLESNRATK